MLGLQLTLQKRPTVEDKEVSVPQDWRLDIALLYPGSLGVGDIDAQYTPWLWNESQAILTRS
jgi:hypothetical protein